MQDNIIHDNSRYFSGTMEYDFEMFTESNKTKNKCYNKEYNSNKANYKKMKLANHRKKYIIANSLLIGILIAFFIFGLSIRAETVKKIDCYNTLLSEKKTIHSQNTSLEKQIISRTSYNRVAKKAKKLGMQPTTKKQIIYLQR